MHYIFDSNIFIYIQCDSNWNVYFKARNALNALVTKNRQHYQVRVRPNRTENKNNNNNTTQHSLVVFCVRFSFTSYSLCVFSYRNQVHIIWYKSVAFAHCTILNWDSDLNSTPYSMHSSHYSLLGLYFVNGRTFTEYSSVPCFTLFLARAFFSLFLFTLVLFCF